MLLRERPCAQRDIDFHSSIPYAVIFVVFTARFKDGIKQQRVSHGMLQLYVIFLSCRGHTKASRRMLNDDS